MARSPLTDESLREKLRPFLVTVKGTDPAVVEEFLERCSYRPVATYDDVVRQTKACKVVTFFVFA